MQLTTRLRFVRPNSFEDGLKVMFVSSTITMFRECRIFIFISGLNRNEKILPVKAENHDHNNLKRCLRNPVVIPGFVSLEVGSKSSLKASAGWTGMIGSVACCFLRARFTSDWARAFSVLCFLFNASNSAPLTASSSELLLVLLLLVSELALELLDVESESESVPLSIKFVTKEDLVSSKRKADNGMMHPGLRWSTMVHWPYMLQRYSFGDMMSNIFMTWPWHCHCQRIKCICCGLLQNLNLLMFWRVRFCVLG